MIIATQQFGKHRLKVGIVELEQMSIAKQGFGNHVPTSTNQFARQRFGKHVPATTDRMTTNSSRWWSLFVSPKFTKGRTSENAQHRIRDEFKIVRKGVQLFSRSSFECEFNLSAFVGEFGIQLRSVKKRTAEAEEVTHS
jgi:hypothetical protein